METTGIWLSFFLIKQAPDLNLTESFPFSLSSIYTIKYIVMHISIQHNIFKVYIYEYVTIGFVKIRIWVHNLYLKLSIS